MQHGEEIGGSFGEIAGGAEIVHDRGAIQDTRAESKQGLVGVDARGVETQGCVRGIVAEQLSRRFRDVRITFPVADIDDGRDVLARDGARA